MPSARPTKISTRPRRSGFSARTPTAAAPTAATAMPAPTVPSPAAIAADSIAHWATPGSAAALTASAAPEEPAKITKTIMRRSGAAATAASVERVGIRRLLRISRLAGLQVLVEERPPIRRWRQWGESAAPAFEEANEEFEQHEARGLDSDDQPLERQDERVAGEDDDPEAGAARGMGETDDRHRETRMRERKRSDAGEGDGVDKELDELLDEFGQRHRADPYAAALRERGRAADEPQRAGQRRPQRRTPEERSQNTQIGGGQSALVSQPVRERSPPARLDGVDREAERQQPDAERERDREKRDRLIERAQPERRNRLEAEEAAEQRAKDHRQHAARQKQAKHWRLSAVEGADQRQHEPLADVAEHEPEHERRDNGQHDARIGFCARRHAQHPREQFERPRPTRVSQKQRWNCTGRVRQKPNETAHAALLQFPLELAIAFGARPPGDEDESRPAREVSGVLMKPIEQGKIADRPGDRVLVRKRREISLERLDVLGASIAALDDGGARFAGRGRKPVRQRDRASLQAGGLGRDLSNEGGRADREDIGGRRRLPAQGQRSARRRAERSLRRQSRQCRAHARAGAGKARRIRKLVAGARERVEQGVEIDPLPSEAFDAGDRRVGL